jgi:hypothetical protein
MTIEPPITERTKAIQELEAKLLTKFQDVTAEVHQIHELMKRQQTTAEKFKAALKRAVNQLFSQW